MKEKKVSEIVFVTSNMGKVSSAQQYFKNIKLEIYNYDLIEPRTDDIQKIAESKVLQAYELVKKPCIALDAGFFINELNGFPRAFVNFSLDTIGIEGILKIMQGVTDRSCYFEECLAYYDGKEIKYFLNRNLGNLAEEIKGLDSTEKWSKLWHIFIPEHKTDNRTLAERSIEEIHDFREHTASSMKDFAIWYEGKD